MSNTSVVVKGVVKADGTLELAEKLDLPAGPVEVTVQPASRSPSPVEDFMARMEKIWAGQRERGHVPRSKEEIDAEIREMRDEWEEHDREIEALREEGRRLREQQEKGGAQTP